MCMQHIYYVNVSFSYIQRSFYETEIVVSDSGFQNGGRHLGLRFKDRYTNGGTVRVKRKSLKRFHDNRKTIPQRFFFYSSMQYKEKSLQKVQVEFVFRMN